MEFCNIKMRALRVLTIPVVAAVSGLLPNMIAVIYL